MGLIIKLALRNIRTDWFATLAAVLGVALGTATVSVVLALDVNTQRREAHSWSTNPELALDESRTVRLAGFDAQGRPLSQEDAKEETHEDYQVMRSAIRLASLSAFLVGALIVFFTFRVVIEQRRRNIALLRSLGALPEQLAKILLLEAATIGAAGAALGLLLAPPVTVVAAIAGITTTGRAHLYGLEFPWRTMFLVAAIGGLTSILGVLRPLRDVLSLNVVDALQPRAMGDHGLVSAARPRGMWAIALPFMALLYVLNRPFFAEVLPSLAFFVLEAGLVCAASLSLLVLVPQVVGFLGARIGRLAPGAKTAAWFLATRRIQRCSHEFAWSVSSVMMVFALLLSLHVVTHSLKREVVAWANQGQLDGNFYVVRLRGHSVLPHGLTNRLPNDALQVRFSGRTPWPNSILAVDSAALKTHARALGDKGLSEVSGLGPGRVVVSPLMARRYGLGRHDRLRVTGRTREAQLEVVGISDIPYVPTIAPYRDSKTYAVIDQADFDLIEQFAAPVGSAILFRQPETHDGLTWWSSLARSFRGRGIMFETGAGFRDDRVRETNRDFAIFDVILLLTALLSALGIANSLVLSSHLRRREIALLRVLGMLPPQIQRLFLAEGIFVGLLGGLLAVVVGIPLGVTAIGALEVISAFDVDFALPPSYAVLTVVGAVVVSLISAVYPAVRAARIGAPLQSE